MVCFGNNFLALGLGLKNPWLRVGQGKTFAWGYLFRMTDIPSGQEPFSVAQGVGDGKRKWGGRRIFDAEIGGYKD